MRVRVKAKVRVKVIVRVTMRVRESRMRITFHDVDLLSEVALGLFTRLGIAHHLNCHPLTRRPIKA